MKLSDFDYQLPDDLIAQAPLSERNASRLLVVDPGTRSITNRQFTELPTLVNPGDLMIFNNTRVIPARLFGQKASGGKIEVMVERVLNDQELLAHVRASKSPKPGTRLMLEGHIRCIMRERRGDLFLLEQHSQQGWQTLLENHGHMPLPPYIQRSDELADRERYQTVYAKTPGAVAAPTAGLHFDQQQIDALVNMGVKTAEITLHVGAGTFQPIRVDNIDNHIMHAEQIEVSAEVCNLIDQTRSSGHRVIAVGTTVVRSLEAAAAAGQLKVFNGDSQIFIKPGFEVKVVDAMITNFHLPKSTLLMLVSAFAGTELMRQAYQHAVDQQYRFFSYGDAMFIASRE